MKKIPYKEYLKKGIDNFTYELKIYQSENSIIFSVNIKEDFLETIFKNEITINEFHNINNIFKQYSTSKEFFINLLSDLKDDEIIISKNNNDEVELCFLFEFRHKKEEITFILYPETRIRYILYKLCEKNKEIDILNNASKTQKLINEKVKEDFLELKKNINEKINKILNLELELKNIKNKVNNIKNRNIFFIFLIIIVLFLLFLNNYLIKKLYKNEENLRNLREKLIKLEDKLSLSEENRTLINIDTLWPKDLLTINGNTTGEYIEIKSEGIQYGPYKHYLPGDYLIVYKGKNLDNGNFDVFDLNNSINKYISIRIREKKNEIVKYEVTIPDNLKSGIEFRVNNKFSSNSIYIEKIKVYKKKILQE